MAGPATDVGGSRVAICWNTFLRTQRRSCERLDRLRCGAPWPMPAWAGDARADGAVGRSPAARTSGPASCGLRRSRRRAVAAFLPRPVDARAQGLAPVAAAEPRRVGRGRCWRHCRRRAPGSRGRPRGGRSRACVIRSLRSPPRCHRLPRRRARPAHRCGCAGRRGAAADACHVHPARPDRQNGAAEARRRPPPPGAPACVRVRPALSPAGVSPARLAALRPAASPPPAARPARLGSPRAAASPPLLARSSGRASCAPPRVNAPMHAPRQGSEVTSPNRKKPRNQAKNDQPDPEQRGDKRSRRFEPLGTARIARAAASSSVREAFGTRRRRRHAVASRSIAGSLISQEFR